MMLHHEGITYMGTGTTNLYGVPDVHAHLCLHVHHGVSHILAAELPLCSYSSAKQSLSTYACRVDITVISLKSQLPKLP